jgi:AAHS family 4-hydroxybenzoate transporter-like MFS transporter
MASKAVSVTEVFDASPVASSYQIWICFLCFLVTFLDGFDLTVIGVAIPKIGEFLHSKPGALGLAMSAGLVGAGLGSVVLGMLADHFGRKRMLVVSALIFGVFTFLTIFITGAGELALYRFIAGLGLGGTTPNALAFGAEYAPGRLRKTFAATMFAGIPTGATLGGLLGAWFIPRFGWQSLFVFGGIAPIIIALITAAVMPESLEFLVTKGKDKERVRKIVMKIAPALARDEQVEFYPGQKKLPGVPLKNLFTQKRASMTILFWIVLIASYYFSYIPVVWAPTLLHKSGATVTQYSLAYAALNFGAIIAAILVGRLMDWGDPYVILPTSFTLGFVSLVVFGWFSGAGFLAAALLSVACGFFINGSQAGTVTLTAVSYPVDIRGTALGWAYAVAKLGNALAAFAGGYLLGLGWSVSRVCSTNALVGLFCAALILILRGRVAAADRFQAEAASR